MAWYPHARKRELPYAAKMPKRRAAKTVCVHTNGGGTDHGSLYHWFARSGNTVASHFQVMSDGTIEQYIDTDRQAYAQVAGNDHCVSIETEDGGHPSRPWTNAQVDAILGICRWLAVPAKVGSQTGDGIVWHSLFPAYNPHSHDCPGSVRVAQIKKTLIPELGDDDVDDATIDKIAERVKQSIYNDGDYSPAGDLSPNKMDRDRADQIRDHILAQLAKKAGITWPAK